MSCSVTASGPGATSPSWTGGQRVTGASIHTGDNICIHDDDLVSELWVEDREEEAEGVELEDSQEVRR